MVEKETATLGMPWEKDFGYAQAVKVGDTIYLAGQVSHDDDGNVVGVGDMEAQVRAAYANVQKVLDQFGATMANVVDEFVFVTDMDAAFGAMAKIRPEVHSGTPVVANTLIGTPRLAFPELMVEIRCIAKL